MRRVWEMRGMRQVRWLRHVRRMRQMRRARNVRKVRAVQPGAGVDRAHPRSGRGDVRDLRGLPAQPMPRQMRELDHAHALERSRHQHPEQARLRLAHLERLQRPAAHRDLVREVGEPGLAARLLGRRAEPRAELGVRDQALEQLGRALDVLALRCGHA